MSRKLFYGWYNVATGFTGMALSYAMFTVFVFGVFVKPLQDEFGWARGEISLAYAMTNIGVVLASPLLGLFIDRFGVRKVLIPSVILMSLAVASMALLTANLWHFYLLYFLIPVLGAGTLPQSYSRVIIAWFARRRGIALGITLAGFGVGAMLVPVFAQYITETLGWRMAYVGFAVAILLAALPMVVYVMRESPGEMGLNPDGDTDIEAAQGNTAHLARPDVGLSGREAAKTGSYWLILFSFLLVGVGITSVLSHLVPMLTDRGVSARVAALCMASIGPGLILGRVLSGYLMDYFFAPWVTAGFLTGLLLALVILASGTAGPAVFLAAVLVGLATGSEISEIAYICSRYFGPRAFGQIYGIMFAAFQTGSAFAAPLMGRYYDHYGDYIGALWLIAAIVLLGIILIALLGPYPRLFADRR